MDAVTGMDYILYVPEDSVSEKVEALIVPDEVLVERKKKQRKKRAGRGNHRSNGFVMRPIDMRPNIGSLSLSVSDALRKEDNATAIALELHRIGDRGMLPSELLKLLGHDIESCHVFRLRTRFSSAMVPLKVSVVNSENAVLNPK